MCEFSIHCSSGQERTYRVEFEPWPTWAMLESLASTMLSEKGGESVSFTGPNGLRGLVTAKG